MPSSRNPFDDSNRRRPRPLSSAAARSSSITESFEFEPSYSTVTTPREQTFVGHDEQWPQNDRYSNEHYSHDRMSNHADGRILSHNCSHKDRGPIPSNIATSPAASPNSTRKQQRHISFAADGLPSPSVLQSRFADEMDEVRFDDDNNDNFHTGKFSAQEEIVTRAPTIMKRARWGTQRQKGRPKRSKSKFRKGSAHEAKDRSPQENEEPKGRKVYFNIPLPDDMVSPETGLPIAQYPRNKIRTTKYTPLSFLPKNLYYQFQNVANIYFLFIAILGVSVL